MRNGILYTLAVAAMVPLSQIQAQPGPAPRPSAPPMISGQTNTPDGGRERGWKHRTPEERLDYLSEQLNLTEEQKTQLQSLFEEWRAKALEAKTNAQAQLQEILTPEQYEKLQSLHPGKKHWHDKGDEGSQNNDDSEQNDTDSDQNSGQTGSGANPGQ